MTWDFRSFMPSRISGQIVIIIMTSVIIIHLALTAAFLLTRRSTAVESWPEQLATLVQLLDASPAERREALAGDFDIAFPQFGLALADSPPAVTDFVMDPRYFGLEHRLGPRFQVMKLESRLGADQAPPGRVAIRLHDGSFITGQLQSVPPPNLGPIAGTLLAIAITVTLLGLWAARGLTGPLRRFAWAAENFSPGGEIAPLPERGPYEIRMAARALNQMRERIKTLVDDRTRMLAAVSHDLRTPITRLRLRCEFLEDDATRTNMMNELSRMSSMVESVLHFLRDGQRREKSVMLDLATSLQTVCDQFVDLGYEVTYDGPDHVVVRAQADELQRAVTNLVDNAVRHGGKADLQVRLTPPVVTLTVEDAGPGIPGADKESMFEPFVRGDSARGMNGKTGFGLGLSIARSVIEAHGGTLTLLDRHPHGLIARITLPYFGGGASDEDREAPNVDKAETKSARC